MRRYEVKFRWLVDAESGEDAIMKAVDGEGEMVEESAEDLTGDSEGGD